MGDEFYQKTLTGFVEGANEDLSKKGGAYSEEDKKELESLKKEELERLKKEAGFEEKPFMALFPDTEGSSEEIGEDPKEESEAMKAFEASNKDMLRQIKDGGLDAIKNIKKKGSVPTGLEKIEE